MLGLASLASLLPGQSSANDSTTLPTAGAGAVKIGGDDVPCL